MLRHLLACLLTTAAIAGEIDVERQFPKDWSKTPTATPAEAKAVLDRILAAPRVRTLLDADAVIDARAAEWEQALGVSIVVHRMPLAAVLLSHTWQRAAITAGEERLCLVGLGEHASSFVLLNGVEDRLPGFTGLDAGQIVNWCQQLEQQAKRELSIDIFGADHFRNPIDADAKHFSALSLVVVGPEGRRLRAEDCTTLARPVLLGVEIRSPLRRVIPSLQFDQVPLEEAVRTICNEANADLLLPASTTRISMRATNLAAHQALNLIGETVHWQVQHSDLDFPAVQGPKPLTLGGEPLARSVPYTELWPDPTASAPLRSLFVAEEPVAAGFDRFVAAVRRCASLGNQQRPMVRLRPAVQPMPTAEQPSPP